MNVVKKKESVKKVAEEKSEAGCSTDVKKKNKWNSKNKKILLEALKRYGPENIEAISKMLPSISSQDIKLKISEYSEEARKLYEDELLNKWLNCGLYKSEDSLIPEALLFIYLFEDHPPPSEMDGYNIKAIYNFLYDSCYQRTSYLDLSAKDRELLCFLLSRIERRVWPECQQEMMEYIGTVYNKRNIKKVYPGKGGHS
ncbi:unnamed protein product [Xylocopa violacea]|uniref:Myb-like domain-containing protein n=1 Tax=Xylocopa violacea TaxID=135666 RepID=A0ABP1NGH2_XYLVO